jgi:hypothetical protein
MFFEDKNNFDRSSACYAEINRSQHHTYDFILCYSCHEFDVYSDGKAAGSFGASGSPQFLNHILTAAHIPLARPNP